MYIQKELGIVKKRKVKKLPNDRHVVRKKGNQPIIEKREGSEYIQKRGLLMGLH